MREARPDGVRSGLPVAGGRFRRVWFAVLGLLALIWGVFAFTTWQQFALARNSAFSNTDTLAKLVEAWALSTLGRIDDLSSSVESYLIDNRTGGDLARMLRRHQLYDAGLFLTLDVVGPDGSLIATSDGAPAAAAARNFDTDRLPSGNILIGMPRDVNGRILVPITRALHNDSGAAIGSVIVEVDPSYFAGFYADLGLPAGASALLFRADGPLIAHNLATLGAVGRSYPQAALWPALAERSVGQYAAPDLDGVRRLTSFRANGAIPIVVVIGLDERTMFADAWRRMTITGAIGAMFSLTLLAAAFVVLRQLRRRLALAEELAISAAAVESVGSGVVILKRWGSDFDIEQVNPAFLMLTGHVESDIVGHSWRAVAGQHATPPASGTIDGEWTAELQFSRRDGTPFWAELRIAPIRVTSGGGERFVVVLADISGRKGAEQQIIQAKEAAEGASRAKSDFLANMSHELRTPLNAVIGFSEVMEGQMFGPLGSAKYLEYAGDIKRSGEHLLAIISDILDLAKIEAHKIVLEDDDFNVDDVIAACCTLVAGRAEQGGVVVEVASTVRELPLLRADELRVKQILLNLMSNAVKFSPPGSRVRIAARSSRDGSIEVVVADQGCGMDTSELSQAIQPFRQVNASVAQRTEGTGLGLPIAYRLTELHGGRLMLESQPGVGTTAVVRFPVARSVARSSSGRAPQLDEVRLSA